MAQPFQRHVISIRPGRLDVKRSASALPPPDHILGDELPTDAFDLLQIFFFVSQVPLVHIIDKEKPDAALFPSKTTSVPGTEQRIRLIPSNGTVYFRPRRMWLPYTRHSDYITVRKLTKIRC